VVYKICTQRECISDARLCKVIKEAEDGKIGADYGSGVIKQRIARPNEGKSGGYRSIIIFRRGERAFFVYGFAKNDKDNIDESDERDFKLLAKVLLAASDVELKNLIDNGKYMEIRCND
jgi:hypothetical protein